jgi:hypothetical protein
MAGLVNDWLPRPRVLRGPENPFEFDRRNVLILTFFHPMDLGSGKHLIAGPCIAIIMRQRRK